MVSVLESVIKVLKNLFLNLNRLKNIFKIHFWTIIGFKVFWKKFPKAGIGYKLLKKYLSNQIGYQLISKLN